LGVFGVVPGATAAAGVLVGDVFGTAATGPDAVLAESLLPDGSAAADDVSVAGASVDFAVASP